ncbi:collagen alpha-1(XIV) chain-like [Mytilus trossulus]|uniref:collagen alpha-1(XIV) chain-like n=1 Tax=Mytilus trossulus TaxID=6551 RepID=UPI003003DA73
MKAWWILLLFAITIELNNKLCHAKGDLSENSNESKGDRSKNSGESKEDTKENSGESKGGRSGKSAESKGNGSGKSGESKGDRSKNSGESKGGQSKISGESKGDISKNSGESKEGSGACQYDLIFVLDISSSLGPSGFEKTKDYVIETINKNKVGPGQTQIGIITFSDDAKMDIPLKQYKKKDKLIEAIRSIQWKGGVTNTFKGLNVLRLEGFTKKNGYRKKMEKIGILVTDGKSTNEQKTHSEVELLEFEGIKLFTKGISDDIDEEALRTIGDEVPEIDCL